MPPKTAIEADRMIRYAIEQQETTYKVPATAGEATMADILNHCEQYFDRLFPIHTCAPREETWEPSSESSSQPPSVSGLAG